MPILNHKQIDKHLAGRHNQQLHGIWAGFSDEQKEGISEFIDKGPTHDDLIDAIMSGQPGKVANGLRDVYEFEHVGIIGGNKVLFQTKVNDIVQWDDAEIKVGGTVFADGLEVGDFTRSFNVDADDNLIVEHDELILDEAHRGAGFGAEFTQRALNYYTAQGIDAVELGTAWDGARHWARAGFDFDPDSVERSLDIIQDAARQRLNQSEMSEFLDIYSGAVDIEGDGKDGSGYLDMTAPTFPLPADFANLGWADRTKDSSGKWDWAGKRLMDGLGLRYIMPITAEGRNLLTGPIDRDGDGLIYDGTGRERPVSSEGDNE